MCNHYPKDNSQKRDDRALPLTGFTLVEVLIVIAIVAIIAGVSLLSLQGTKNSTDLNNTAKQIVSILRQAQTQAASDYQGAAWGVHFANGTASSTSSSSSFNGYSYERSISMSAVYVSGTLSNFPVLVSGTYSWLAATSSGGFVQSANGYDVVFTSDAGCTSKLAWEVETYTPSNGLVNYWVKIPTLTGSSVIYVCYGNSSVSSDQSNKTGTWDGNYQAVWHLPNGTTLSAGDSTSNGDNGTIGGATGMTGKVGGSGSFNGSGNYILGANMVNIAMGTVSAWVKINTLPVSDALVAGFVQGNGGGTYDKDIKITSGGNAAFYVYDGNGKATGLSGAISTGAWAYVVGTADGSNAYIYLNGSQAGSVAAGNTYTSYGAANTLIGGSAAGFTYLNAGIDEVRISNIARTPSWVLTEYNNQLSPSTFYTVGSQVAGGSGGGGGAGTASFYALFSSAYSPTSTVNRYLLPTTVAFRTSTVPASSSLDVVFSVLSGASSVSTSITLYSTVQPSFSSTIRVASSGEVSF